MTDNIISRLQSLLEEMQRTNIRSYPLKPVVLEQWRLSLRSCIEDAKAENAAKVAKATTVEPEPVKDKK